MKRRVTPFSLGLALSLLAIAMGVFTAIVYVHRANALTNVGPDRTADFPPNTSTGAFYTLSDTLDVKNADTMSVAVYRAGAKPTTNVILAVAYQSGSPQCAENNLQGYAGATFTYGSGDTGASGIPTRNTTITIPTTAWVSDGAGYKVTINGTLGTATADCMSGDRNHVNFTITAPSGYIIGAGGNKRFAIAQGTYQVGGSPLKSTNGTTNYKIPFAPPCTMTSNTQVNAQIYDMDNDGTHPIIQPTTATVKVVDTTNGGSTNVTYTFSGQESDGQNAVFTFTVKPEHTYIFEIDGVNLNNILQIQIPYDSVNAQIDCSPEGNITSSAAAACTAIQGWIYNPNSTSSTVQYYVYVDPSSTPANSYASPVSASNFIGPYSANLSTPASPSGGSHGFKVNIPSQVSGHGYKGPWAADSYYIYAVDSTTGSIDQMDSLTVPAGTCAHVSCGTTNFALGGSGIPDTFTVNMDLNGATVGPPGSPTFTITVTGSGSGTNSQTFSGVGDDGITGGDMYSDPVTFTPAAAGNYSVTWSYYGVSGCGDTSTARYTPYFTVEGGDIAAGAGVPNGSCSEPSADIVSQNTNTPASYTGGGSVIGALATGDITNFITGLGLGGGVAAQSGHGLSFANTNNSKSDTPPNYGGGFGANSIPCVNDYYANATGTSVSGGVFNQSNVPAAPGTYNFNANVGKATGYTLTLGSGTSGADMFIHPGETVSLYVYGNVYITNNIKYDGYTPTTVPRFNLYVDGNVYIDPNVTELHGVYIAQKSSSLPGNITTCADSVSPSTEPYATCSKRLLVVGSMAAEGQLLLTRTHGHLVAAPGVPAEPAETFQYNPELWLNSSPLSNVQPQAYTSLPPVL